MSIVLNSTGGGSVTINEPTTASNFTLTLPAATGDVMVSGNMPAFSVWASAEPAVSANTFVKIALNTETFDTNNCFDSTTNYRFTPTVAGYYQITGRAGVYSTTGVVSCYCSIYKNGTRYKRGSDGGVAAASNVSDIVYFNGSTDYVELYIYQFNGATAMLDGGEAQRTYFSGSMVRGA
jgi:hypothetical protein